jgi:hypothetical protein
VDEILRYAVQPGESRASVLLHLPLLRRTQRTRPLKVPPGFLLFAFVLVVFALVMMYVVAPRHGRTNPLVYVSICSIFGALSVMAVKGLGVAVKLTFAGNNQFTHPSTYVFVGVTATCILIQMNYLNKALDTFSTNVYAELSSFRRRTY